MFTFLLKLFQYLRRGYLEHTKNVGAPPLCGTPLYGSFFLHSREVMLMTSGEEKYYCSVDAGYQSNI